MKFSDLMNGDWVIRKGIPSEPMQVVDFNVSKGLVFLDFQGRGITENIENIEPIAITDEILEKNGFIKETHFIDWRERDLYNVDKHSDLYIIKDYYEDEPYTLCKLYCDSEEGTVVIDIISVCYIHKLQNALKVCHSYSKDIIL